MDLHEKIQEEINDVWQRYGRPPTLIRLSKKYLIKLREEMKDVIGMMLADNIYEYNGIEVIEDLRDDDIIKCYIN